MKTPISEHARQEEGHTISETARETAGHICLRIQDRVEWLKLEELETIIQLAIDSATAAKEREIERLKDKLGDIAADKGVVLYEDHLAEMEAVGLQFHAAKDENKALQARVRDLEEVIENAKSAFGEHPDTDMDLAERISQLRDENRAWFHKYTQNIQ